MRLVRIPEGAGRGNRKNFFATALIIKRFFQAKLAVEKMPLICFGLSSNIYGNQQGFIVAIVKGWFIKVFPVAV